MSLSTTKSWSTMHPLNPEDRGAIDAMRKLLESHKGELKGTAARPRFDEIMGYTPPADGVTYESDRIGRVPGVWCRPRDVRSVDEAILYLHGGWHVFGSALAYRHFVGHVAARAGAAAFVAGYRLAPEHRFPAAVEDVRACYRGLIGRGWRRIAIVGDSAGGGLSLVLLSIATAEKGVGGVVPVCAVVLSPVTDMTFAGGSWETRAAVDLYFTRAQAAALLHAYLGDHDPADPLASPVYGDLTGLPPIRVHVGEHEVLLDDSRRYVARAVAAGVDAKVDVWQGMQHVFAASVGKLSAAARSLDSIGAFLRERLAMPPS